MNVAYTIVILCGISAGWIAYALKVCEVAQ